LEYSKTSNKQNSTTEAPTLIGTTQNNITSITHNNTVAGISICNISHSPSLDRDAVHAGHASQAGNSASQIKLSCCIENCNRLGDKIINFLKVKGILDPKELNDNYSNSLINQIKNLIRLEILKIPIKPKSNNLSHISEVVTENFTCNKNSPQQSEMNTTPNLNAITETNFNNFNSNILDEQTKILELEKIEKNLLNINSLNSENSSNFQNLQNPALEAEPHKIINNIKQVIQKNKNSRNHKDIIHEDYHTDSDKYNLNH